MNDYTDRILRQYLPRILDGYRVAIPDDEEEMNWRIFFAHSQDMQGFRADIFTGGPNEDQHPIDRGFVGLRPRWNRDSRSLIADLAKVWENPDCEQRLRRNSNPFRSAQEKAAGVAPLLEMLKASGIEGAVVFAETLSAFKGDKLARKTNRMIRAYVQSAALLHRNHDGSFRKYLASLVSGVFPPTDVGPHEVRWVSQINVDFYNVGPAIANYMVCDWLLDLWRYGRIEWFTSHKPDSVFEKAVSRGLIPAEAGTDFVAFCRDIRIPDGFGAVSGKPCPPRVLNECIWIDGNALGSGRTA